MSEELVSFFFLFLTRLTWFEHGLGSDPVIFEGRTEGRIVPARGPKVFGWDAVFEPLGYDMTCVQTHIAPGFVPYIDWFYFSFLQIC